MNKAKYILPAAAVLALLAPAAVSAQQIIAYHDPFDAFFDTMNPAPRRFAGNEFMGPKMNVADMKDKIEIKAELPGMSEKDVTLSIDDSVLTLSGQRKEEASEENADYYLKEMSSGSFSRSVKLPKNIDESKIEAVFKDGILTISIPKTEAKADDMKKIPIKKAE